MRVAAGRIVKADALLREEKCRPSEAAALKAKSAAEAKCYGFGEEMAQAVREIGEAERLGYADRRSGKHEAVRA